MPKKILEINDLEVSYGDIKVLNKLSINLKENERIGIFGPNGHGKTTLLKAISGLIKISNGDILFEGENITDLDPLQIINKGIVHVPQANNLFPRMSIMDNLKLGAYSKRASNEMNILMESVFEIFPWLKERKKQKCKTLSGGERQMLAIAVGLMGKPKILMLYEPTLGLAPKIKYELKEVINDIAETGVPLILVEQDVEFLMEFANRLYLIEKGRNVLEMDEKNMLDHKEILDIYFSGKDISEVISK